MSASSNSSFELTIALVAGEASGDTLGADLLKELKRRHPHARFIGIGGPKMIREGMESWFPMEMLSVMGFFEVLKRLPQLLRLRKELVNRLLELKPDVFIGIDAPDFNFTVERKLKQQAVKTVHYVGPSVWAWREKRLLKVKKAVDGVLVLFPFEPDYYHRYQIPVAYVGHPLAQQVPETPDKTAARKNLALPAAAKVTAILPGSRMSEINQMIDPYLESAKKLLQSYPQMTFVIPAVHDKARQRIQEAIEHWQINGNVLLLDGQAQTALKACDQALVTSGTATLECALLRRPLILAIKVHPVSYWIMSKLATTQWIGLPNILAGQSIVPELIQDQASAENIAHCLQELIESEEMRNTQLKNFNTQYQQLKQNSSQKAVDAIDKWCGLSSADKA